MITQTACWEITCDECGEDMYADGDFGTPHYTSEDNALANIVPCGEECSASPSYELHRRGDRVLCVRHAHEADCERDGHRWGEWQPLGVGETRSCKHCDEWETRAPEATR